MYNVKLRYPPPSPKWMFSQKLFFISSLLLNKVNKAFKYIPQPAATTFAFPFCINPYSMMPGSEKKQKNWKKRGILLLLLLTDLEDIGEAAEEAGHADEEDQQLLPQVLTHVPRVLGGGARHKCV